MQTTIPAPEEAVKDHPRCGLTVTPLMVVALAAGISVEDVAAYASAPRSLDAGRWE